MYFSGRSHSVYQIQGKEFISICKQYLAIRYPDSLEPLFYHCYLCSRICLSNERIFFNYCKICSVSNSFCINYSIPMNKQNTKRHINIFFHFAMISLMQNK